MCCLQVPTLSLVPIMRTIQVPSFLALTSLTRTWSRRMSTTSPTTTRCTRPATRSASTTTGWASPIMPCSRVRFAWMAWAGSCLHASSCSKPMTSMTWSAFLHATRLPRGSTSMWAPWRRALRPPASSTSRLPPAPTSLAHTQTPKTSARSYTSTSTCITQWTSTRMPAASTALPVRCSLYRLWRMPRMHCACCPTLPTASTPSSATGRPRTIPSRWPQWCCATRRVSWTCTAPGPSRAKQQSSASACISSRSPCLLPCEACDPVAPAACRCRRHPQCDPRAHAWLL
mmetsp:Transcript_1799/g.4085  ORF Transcript_1799/g.4085 Transcript_1799/m.4085 type:complete len:287 (+) Transcript_1799:492-1352(+)